MPAGRRLPGQRGKEDVRLLMNAYLKWMITAAANARRCVVD